MARIILVDDDQEILQMGRAILATNGHDVLTASGALEALELLKTYGADAMITDANMPQHTGYDLLRTIRKDEKHGQLPIAMLTGRRERKDIVRALELGVDDYIIKPIDPLLLLKKVEHLLSKSLPQEQHPELDFAQAQSHMPGRVSAPVEMRAITEIGLSFVGAHQLSEGQLVHFETELFTQIGIEPPPMKVLSSLPQAEGGGFETRLLFIGADEPTLRKIRAWIFAQATKAGKKAAS